MKTEPSAQSPFQKLNFGKSSQKTRKRRYQAFLALSSFTGFLCFVPNTLSGIVSSHCMGYFRFWSFRWSFFPYIQSEYVDLLCNLLTPSKCKKIRSRKNSVWGHFSRSVNQFHVNYLYNVSNVYKATHLIFKAELLSA